MRPACRLSVTTGFTLKILQIMAITCIRYKVHIFCVSKLCNITVMSFFRLEMYFNRQRISAREDLGSRNSSHIGQVVVDEWVKYRRRGFESCYI